MEDTPKVTGHRWTVLGSLAAANSVGISILLMLGLLLPSISKELDLSPSQQGWLGSSALLASLFLVIPVNTWMSRYRPWRIASLSFLGVAGFVFLQAWAPVFAILLLGRVGMGLAFLLIEAPRALLIQQWSSIRQISMTNGVIISVSDVGLGLAFFITPFIMTWLDGWRNALYVWGGISLLAALAWIVLGKERITPDYQQRMASQASNPLASLLKYKELWILGMGMAGGLLVESAFSVFWPTFAQDHFQVSISVVGFALGLFFFAAAPWELLVTVLPLFTRNRLWMLAFFGLATAASHIGLLYTGSTPLILLLSVARGASIAYFPVIVVMVYQLPGIRPREVAVGISFTHTCAIAGQAIGPLLVGFLQEATGDLQLALLITTFSPLALLATALLLRARALREVREIPT